MDLINQRERLVGHSLSEIAEYTDKKEEYFSRLEKLEERKEKQDQLKPFQKCNKNF